MKRLIDLIAKTKPEWMTKREGELRDLILRHPKATDKSLADILWPQDRHQVEYLRQTKERLFNHIEHAILDLKENSGYQGRFAECHKEFMAVQILQSLGMRKEMLYFAERLIRKAQRMEISEIVTSVADTLYLHYGTIAGDLTQAKKYLKLAQESEKIHLAERKAQRLFTQLASSFTRSQVGNSKTQVLSQEIATTLMEGLANNFSFRYRYYAYYAIAIHAQLTQDKDLLVETCDDALKFFQSKTYPIPNAVQFLFGFELRASLALQTKDYLFARRAVKMGMELMEGSPYNYSICLIYKAMIGFHQEDNALVLEAIVESENYRTFPNLAEQWHIIDAFAHFLEIHHDDPFRLGRFLNQVPIFSQDKQSLNITILVIQVLFYIKKRKFGVLIDRWDALTKYTNRYLKKDHTFRSACFIKMVLLLPAHNFHPVAVERHAQAYLEKLAATPERSDIELVPYERLWKVVMTLIEEYHVA